MKEEFNLGLSSSSVFMNILFRREGTILFSFGFLFCPSAPIFTLGNRRENTNISCDSLSQENVCKSLTCIIRHCLRQDQTHNFPANSDLVIQLALSPKETWLSCSAKICCLSVSESRYLIYAQAVLKWFGKGKK